eukprot:2802130-Amphidinium_carterae.1
MDVYTAHREIGRTFQEVNRFQKKFSVSNGESKPTGSVCKVAIQPHCSTVRNNFPAACLGKVICRNDGRVMVDSFPAVPTEDRIRSLQ